MKGIVSDLKVSGVRICKMHTARDSGAANTFKRDSFFCFSVQTNLHRLCISFIFHIYDGRHAFIFTAERVTGSLLFASFVC